MVIDWRKVQNPTYSLEFAAIVPEDHLIEMCELTRVIRANNLDRIIDSIKIVYEGADRLKWIETATDEWSLEIQMDGAPSYVGATLKC